MPCPVVKVKKRKNLVNKRGKKRVSSTRYCVGIRGGEIIQTDFEERVGGLGEGASKAGICPFLLVV